MVEQIYAGKPVDGIRIIDIHAHMGYMYHMHIPAHTAEDILHSMDLLGIDMCCVTHHMGISSDYQMGNTLAAEAMKQYPGRFMAYTTLNPHNPERVLDELKRCFYDYGSRLIKFHPLLHQYPITGGGYIPALEFAERCNAPVLIHTWVMGDEFSSLNLFEEVAKRFPDVPLLMGHVGGPMGAWRAIEIARECNNVYLDQTQSESVIGLYERLVREVGASRILFGTDVPFLDPYHKIGTLGLSKITFDEKKQIFSENARRLLYNVMLP